MFSNPNEARWYHFDLRFFFVAQAIAAVTIGLYQLTALSLPACVALAFPIVFFLDLPLFVGAGIFWLVNRVRALLF